MKVYKVTNVFHYVCGSTYHYDCGIFASESIAKMVAKATEAYNNTHISLVDKIDQINHLGDDPENPAPYNNKFDIAYIEVALEEFELVEDKESIEAKFAELQRHFEQAEAELEADLDSANMDYDTKHRSE